MRKKHLVKQMMKEEGMTQAQVARELGVTRAAICALLKYKKKTPKAIKQLIGLAVGEAKPIECTSSGIRRAAKRLGHKVTVRNGQVIRLA